MGRHICAVLISILFTSMNVTSQNGSKITREKYVKTYSDLAIKEMKRTGIPASITLAQGCLESDNGNSSLTVQGNNHFGIKCHDWKGGKMYHDDDEKGECFRKYKSAYESYIDHSLFLTTKSRYEFLFDLRTGDYKRWAKGLQKAGYATSNKYSSLLIKIIEENNLHEYDKGVVAGGDKTTRRPQRYQRQTRKETEIGSARAMYKNNRIDYIIVREGDTPELLREELDLYPNEIYKYNNLEKGMALDSGMIIYLQPKRMHAEKGNDVHVVQEGETLRTISQMYGVKLGSIYRMNHLDEGSVPEVGTELNLRKSKKAVSLPLDEPREEEEPVQEMEFEFDGF